LVERSLWRLRGKVPAWPWRTTLEKLREVINEVHKEDAAGLAMECRCDPRRDVERAVQDCGAIGGELLVNSAGNAACIDGGRISEEEWDRVMTVNVKDRFLMSRAVLRSFESVAGESS